MTKFTCATPQLLLVSPEQQSDAGMKRVSGFHDLQYVIIQKSQQPQGYVF